MADMDVWSLLYEIMVLKLTYLISFTVNVRIKVYYA